jgi:hypothetical protein
MALSEFEIEKVKTVMESFIAKRRPPEEIRDEVDLFYRIENQSVEIYELRALYHRVGEKIESPIAKTTYNRASGKWKIFWMRSDLKWHGYSEQREVNDIKQFVRIVDEDKFGCFWG